MDYLGRQLRLMQSMQQQRVSAMLVTHMPNIRYLCGFTGSAGVLAVFCGNNRRKPLLAFFTDGRYTIQAKEEVSGARIVIAKQAAMAGATEWLSRAAGQAMGIEADHMTIAQRAALSKAVAGKFRFKELSQVVERLRAIKELEEIHSIQAAVRLASGVFDAVVQDIRPGMPESGIAAEIEYMCRRLGAEGMSFDTLVAAGARSALPHGVASQNPVPANGFVILDFGVILAGYCSDMTRTVHMGRPDKNAVKMYEAVLESQLAGIDSVKPGVETSKVDSAARKILVKAGLGRYFTHSTGHGVGLEIHELPSLRKGSSPAQRKQKRTLGRSSVKSTVPDVLEPGMIITIEPGAYVPGCGGVRIEDMVLVTDTGCEVLTPTRKDLIVI
ncbi:MAG: Peptidase family protein [Acidobacteriales bacterium]|nr:Peptidase family protein [Terriglobales bacterium]